MVWAYPTLKERRREGGGRWARRGLEAARKLLKVASKGEGWWDHSGWRYSRQ